MAESEPDYTAFLIGRRFPATSGNVARIERVGDAAIRAVWINPDSAADRAEFEAWTMRMLEEKYGGDFEQTTCEDIRQEASRYAAWREKAGRTE